MSIVDHFIKHKPLISEEWVGKYLFDKKKKRAAVNHYLHHTESHVNVSFHWFLANPIAHA